MSGVQKESGESLELFSVVLGLGACSLINPPFAALIGFALGESATAGTAFAGTAGGFAAWGAASIAWRRTNQAGRNLELNAVMYAAPALSLTWLFAFSLVGDVDAPFLILGAALIILANAGMGLRAARVKR